MFKLTKFTGEPFFINPDTLKFVEACGDTVITMISGERVLVRESPEEIQEAFMEYKRSIAKEPLVMQHS